MTEQRTVRRLLSHSVVYGIGDLLTKMARYILVPIYIAVMTPADIGQMAVLYAVMMVCWAFSCLGLGAVVRRFYLPQVGIASGNHSDSHLPSGGDIDVGEDPMVMSRRDAWVGGLWWTRLFVAIVPTLGLCAVASAYSEQLFPLVPLNLVIAACFAGYLRASTDTVESWLIIREEPVRYRLLTFSQFTLTTTLILVAVFGLSMGLAGVIFGELIAAALWTIVTGIIVTRSQRPSIRDVRWSQAFRYAWPIVPHTVFMWLLVSGDRVILQYYVPSTEIGIYEVAYVFGSMLMVVAQGLRAAWLPDYFRTAERPDGMVRYARLTNLYLLAVFTGASAIVLFCPELIRFIGRGAYEESVPLCRIVIIGVTWFACFVAFNQPLLLRGKTAILAILSASGVVLNFSLNFALIPSIGTTGSAIATVAAYAFMAVASLAYSRVQLGVQWPLRSLCVGFLLLVGIVVFAPHFGTLSVGSILGRVVALAVIIAIVQQTTMGRGFPVDKQLQRN